MCGVWDAELMGLSFVDCWECGRLESTFCMCMLRIFGDGLEMETSWI